MPVQIHWYRAYQGQTRAAHRSDRDDATIQWIGLRALKRGHILPVESILSTDPFEVMKAAEQTGNDDPPAAITLEQSRAHVEKMTVAELKRFCKRLGLDDTGLKPALKQRILDWFSDNQSKFSDVQPQPPPPVPPPPPPALNGEDEADDVHS